MVVGEHNDTFPLEGALRRRMAQLRQMQERSGPEYELALERSRLINAAWRAAGSPRRVSRVHTSGGLAYRFTGRNDGRRTEPATLDDWTAWQTWQRERERLRGEVRASSRTGNGPTEPALRDHAR